MTSSSYIQFGYWDSLRKGLLAGERLAVDLKRLELAYLDQNRREYELTRHVSLLAHDPAALMRLKQEGVCEVDLPEALFDADYPGHYFRRLKSVTLTIPCVAGPYASINCTLTLLHSRLRTDSRAAADDYLEQGADDPRFLRNFSSVRSIATSHGQNDAGMFELNFRDERYLPFELAGAISRWRIDMPKDCNAFDFETLTDVIMRVSYTAREGGESLRRPAAAALAELRATAAALDPPLQRLVSARHEFPTEWRAFLSPATPATPQRLTLALDHERFPFLFRGMDVRVSRVTAYVQGATSSVAFALTPPEGAAVPLSPTQAADFPAGVSATGSWQISPGGGPAFAAQDLLLLFTYTVSSP